MSERSYLDDDHEEEDSGGHGSGGGHGGEELWLVSYADMMTLLCGFFLILLSFAKLDDNKFEAVKKQAAEVFGGEYQQPFEQVTRAIRGVVDKLGISEQLTIVENEKGVELSFRGGFFFESASTELRPEARKLLDVLVPELRSEARSFYFKVEGHTDAVPIRTSTIASNWELSSLRACQVIRLFESAGFAKERLKAIGYADTVPVEKETGLAGVQLTTAQSRNRRVVIKILKSPDAL